MISRNSGPKTDNSASVTYNFCATFSQILRTFSSLFSHFKIISWHCRTTLFATPVHLLSFTYTVVLYRVPFYVFLELRILTINLAIKH